MIETRPGVRTTELWVTVATVIGAVAAAFADVLPARYAAAAAVIGTVAYAISRGLAKHGVPAEIDEPDFEPDDEEDFSDAEEAP